MFLLWSLSSHWSARSGSHWAVELVLCRLELAGVRVHCWAAGWGIWAVDSAIDLISFVSACSLTRSPEEKHSPKSLDRDQASKRSVTWIGWNLLSCLQQSLSYLETLPRSGALGSEIGGSYHFGCAHLRSCFTSKKLCCNFQCSWSLIEPLGGRWARRSRVAPVELWVLELLALWITGHSLKDLCWNRLL